MITDSTFAVIILAAGKGKRMNNRDIPKVLLPVAGKPMIQYVLDTVGKLNPDKIVIIAGYLKEKVISYLNNLELRYEVAIQEEQLGTGHAVAQARRFFSNYDGDVLILSGDVPFIEFDTLRDFIALHFQTNSDLSVLTSSIPDPFGYGRIIRNYEGEFLRIAEEKDANESEKQIKEFNSGIYIAKSKLIFNWLNQLKNDNVQNEYYLTDIVSIAHNSEFKVSAFNIANYQELLGANTYEQLKELENIYQGKI